jgi:hypothetical protein
MLGRQLSEVHRTANSSLEAEHLSKTVPLPRLFTPKLRMRIPHHYHYLLCHLPLCTMQFCPSCARHPHLGLSCTENARFRSNSDTDAGGTLIRGTTCDVLAKKFPKCQCFAKKEMGCNHIFCMCGADWCWLFLENFEGPADEGRKACYVHSYGGHGGMYGVSGTVIDRETLGMAS